MSVKVRNESVGWGSLSQVQLRREEGAMTDEGPADLTSMWSDQATKRKMKQENSEKFRR